MAQQPANDFNIDPASTSGTDLAGILNRLNNVLLTMRSGDSRPTSATNGTLWLDTSNSSFHYVYLFDGTNDLEIARITVGSNEIRISNTALEAAGGSILGGLNVSHPSADTALKVGSSVIDQTSTVELVNNIGTTRLEMEYDATNDTQKINRYTNAGVLDNVLEFTSTTISSITSFVIKATSTAGRLLTLFNTAGGISVSIDSTTANGGISQRDSAGAYEEDWMKFNRNGSVEMYYNGTKIAETSTTGFDIAAGALTVNQNGTGLSAQIKLVSDSTNDCYVVLTEGTDTARGLFHYDSSNGDVNLERRDNLNASEAKLTLESTGQVSIGTAAAPTNANELANKAYVDSKFPGLTGGTFTTNDGKTVTYNADGVITSVV